MTCTVSPPSVHPKENPTWPLFMPTAGHSRPSLLYAGIPENKLYVPTWNLNCHSIARLGRIAACLINQRGDKRVLRFFLQEYNEVMPVVWIGCTT